ncbi:MAG: cytochrome c [Bacteroidia bacterium]|jgi:hypothetical protein|nr:cytochrome c [Bacteroidia bacterium]
MRFVITSFLFFASCNLLVAQSIAYSQVKPIVDAKCVSCHRTDGYAPFSLERFDDLKKRSLFIKHVVSTGYMPPWKPNNHYRSFANDKSLTAEERRMLIEWIDSGCVEGKPVINQLGNKYSSGSQFNRKPDLVLQMSAPFEVPPINQNVYICYKIPFELPNDTFVSAIEFVPGNKSVVHHASYQILAVEDDVNVNAGPAYFMYDADTLNRVKDDHDYRYFKLIGQSGAMPIEMYHNGWLPGTSVQQYPKGIGFHLPKKGVLLIRNFHYSPTAIPQKDLSKFYLFFSEVQPERKIGFAAFKPKNPTADGKWYIKANDSNFTAYINVKFHNDVSLLNINPHMHRLGKYFIAYALTATNDTIKLIEIPNWDFNWQEFYRFQKMVKIPAGSVLHAEAIYDNSASNPENPHNPPQDVLFEWGMNDDSEMMRLVLLYLPYQVGDEKISLE